MYIDEPNGEPHQKIQTQTKLKANPIIVKPKLNPNHVTLHIVFFLLGFYWLLFNLKYNYWLPGICTHFVLANLYLQTKGT